MVSGTRALPKLVVVEVEGGVGQRPRRGRWLMLILFEPQDWDLRGRDGGGGGGENPPYVWKHRSSTPLGPLPCSPLNFNHNQLRQGTGTADHLTLLRLFFIFLKKRPWQDFTTVSFSSSNLQTMTNYKKTFCTMTFHLDLRWKHSLQWCDWAGTGGHWLQCG